MQTLLAIKETSLNFLNKYTYKLRVEQGNEIQEKTNKKSLPAKAKISVS